MFKQPSQQTILIIDDNVTNLKVIVEYLEAYSFEILTALTGEDGIKQAQLGSPDLILLDVQMPGIDGFETCRRLQAKPETAHIPIIFMTALTDTRDKVRGLESGAVDYITKPIESAELLARVNTHLQLQGLKKQLQAHTEELEAQVQERTATLEHLLNVVRQQSDQLRQLTDFFLENQGQHQGQAQSLQRQVAHDLALLHNHLNQAQELLQQPHMPSLKQMLAKHLEEALTVLVRTQAEATQANDTLQQAVLAQQTLRSNPLLQLSDREYEIFQLLAQGKTTAEIGEELILAKTTVSTYRRRILDKLEVENLAELMDLATKYDVSPTPPRTHSAPL